MKELLFHVEPSGKRPIEVRVAHSAWERTRGLLGRPAPAAGSALLLTRCCAVHTMGMRYAIDVVFLDAQGTVHAVHHAVAPWRMRRCAGARHTLELAAGQARVLGLQPGARLRAKPLPSSGAPTPCADLF